MTQLSWKSYFTIAASTLGLANLAFLGMPLSAQAADFSFSTEYQNGTFSATFSGENLDEDNLLTYDVPSQISELTEFSATWQSTTWDLASLQTFVMNLETNEIIRIYTKGDKNAAGEFDFTNEELIVDGLPAVKDVEIVATGSLSDGGNQTPSDPPSEPVIAPPNPPIPSNPQPPTDDVTSVPEPGLALGLIAVGVLGARKLATRK